MLKKNLYLQQIYLRCLEVFKVITLTLVTNTILSILFLELLQSIKIGSNKSSLIKTEEESSSLNSNVQYSYTDFNSVDHRVKLHIILNVFEYESEELALLLRVSF